MAKKLLCPLCNAKNSLYAQKCVRCFVEIEEAVGNLWPQKPYILDVGPSIPESGLPFSLLAAFGGAFLMLLLENSDDLLGATNLAFQIPQLVQITLQIVVMIGTIVGWLFLMVILAHIVSDWGRVRSLLNRRPVLLSLESRNEGVAVTTRTIRPRARKAADDDGADASWWQESEAVGQQHTYRSHYHIL